MAFDFPISETVESMQGMRVGCRQRCSPAEVMLEQPSRTNSLPLHFDLTIQERFLKKALVHGLNVSFTEGPVQFLHECEICESLRLQDYVRITPAGVYDFDLIPQATYGTKYALVSLASENKNAADQEKPITAYWLPWRPNKLEQIEIGNEAKYSFTSRLAGCQMQIVPPAGPRTRTKVLHIAGNTPREWRAEEAKKALSCPSGTVHGDSRLPS